MFNVHRFHPHKHIHHHLIRNRQGKPLPAVWHLKICTILSAADRPKWSGGQSEISFRHASDVSSHPLDSALHDVYIVCGLRTVDRLLYSVQVNTALMTHGFLPLQYSDDSRNFHSRIRSQRVDRDAQKHLITCN